MTDYMQNISKIPITLWNFTLAYFEVILKILTVEPSKRYGEESTLISINMNIFVIPHVQLKNILSKWYLREHFTRISNYFDFNQEIEIFWPALNYSINDNYRRKIYL